MVNLVTREFALRLRTYSPRLLYAGARTPPPTSSDTRSPRWGSSRIAEVRANDIGQSSNTHAADPPGPPTGTSRTNGNGRSNGADTLPIGNNGNEPSHEAPTPPSPNGNGTPKGGRPLRTNGKQLLPNGNGGRSGGSADSQPSAAAPPDGPGHHPPSATPAVRRITTVAVLAVALVAGVASYDHQRVLASIAGEGWRSYLLPLSVDGLIVAASMTMSPRCPGGVTLPAVGDGEGHATCSVSPGLRLDGW